MSRVCHWDLLATDIDVDFEKELGSGSFGSIFAATVKEVGPAAVKRICKLKLAAYSGPYGLEAEAMVMEELECGLLLGATPGVVGAAGLFEDEKFYYLLMPLVAPAKTCEDVKDPFELLLILVSLLNTVERCHVEGVMHRDLRADNVMLVSLEDPKRTLVKKGVSFSETLVPLVIDFSLAIRAHSSEYIFWNSDVKYMAPEVLSEASYGKEVDLFAVGVMGEQLAAKIDSSDFLEKVFVPFCRVLMSPDPKERSSWREFLLREMHVAEQLYRDSFPQAAAQKTRSNSVRDEGSKCVMFLQALVMEGSVEGTTISFHRAIQTCLKRPNSVNASFVDLRAFVAMKSNQWQRRGSLNFSEGDSVFSAMEGFGYPIDGSAAVLDDGTELFDNQEILAEFGVHRAPPVAQQGPVADPSPGPATVPKAQQCVTWGLDLNESPMKAAMAKVEKIAALRAAQFVRRFHKNMEASYATAVAAAISNCNLQQDVDGDDEANM